MATTTTFVADVTTGHDHLTATPAQAMITVSSTQTPLAPTPPPATNHMTYNSALFSTTLLPHLDHILTANNAVALVTGADSILLTLALPLDKVLLVLSLSSNLLFVSQVTE
ncbi:unnamed protein product [Prunus brigantina]